MLFGKYFLQEITIPIPCKKCGFHERNLMISQKFFGEYLKIPLGKTVDIMCSNCLDIVNKKRFLKEQLDDSKDVKLIIAKMNELTHSSKVPFKFYTSSIIFVVVLVGTVAYETLQVKKEKQFIQSYREEPKGNMLVGVKMEKEHFPYFLVYVDRVEDDQIYLSPWSYGYEGPQGLNKGMSEAKKEIKASNMDHFGEEVCLSKSEFLNLQIIQIAKIG